MSAHQSVQPSSQISSERVFSDESLRQAFTLLYWEGAFAVVYDTWVGPTYLSGLAGQLGVPILCVSLISSAAWIGAVGQLMGAWAFERIPSYKRYTIAVAGAARGLWILPLFLAAYWTYQLRVHGKAFPSELWFMFTAGVACLAALFASSSATAWSAWMRALVPEKIRGRFFGMRHRVVMGAMMLAHLFASFFIDWRPEGYHAGFALLGTLALIAAATSTGLLSRVKDVEKIETVTRDIGQSRTGFFSRLLEPLKDKRFRVVVIFGATFNGMIQLAGPYFPYWFAKEIHIPMSHMAIWLVLFNLGCMLAAGAWGRRIDRTGDSRPVLRLTACLLALSPLFYIFPNPAWIRFLAPVDYLTNGMAWVGYQIALTTLLFKSIPPERAALCFSLYSACSGLAGAICNVVGGQLAAWLIPVGGFRALWVVASLARLGTIAGLYSLLYFERTSERVSARSERRFTLLRFPIRRVTRQRETEAAETEEESRVELM